MQKLLDIMPGVWSLEMSTPDYAVRSFVIIGSKRAVVFDSLTQPRDLFALKDLLAGRAFHIVYSHGDWDHVWGTGGLGEFSLAITAHSECLQRFNDDIPRALRQKQLAEPGTWDKVHLMPPDITFSSRLDLDLGDVTLELHHLPGHTRDSIVGWIPDWGILLGGDSIETPLPVVNSARLVAGWLAWLEEWAARPELTRAVPSHGSVSGRESLDETIKYLRALQGDQEFDLPASMEDFYRETHQKNLIVVNSGLELHE